MNIYSKRGWLSVCAGIVIFFLTEIVMWVAAIYSHDFTIFFRWWTVSVSLELLCLICCLTSLYYFSKAKTAKDFDREKAEPIQPSTDH